MTPDVVVDVGNTRVKWGRVSPAPTDLLVVAPLPPDDEAAWRKQIDLWNLPSPASWVVTGVHPARRDRLADWIRRRGDDVRVLDSYRQLPLQVLVDEPDKVGIDRLFNTVAANHYRAPGGSAVVVDAGSAVTVDLVDEAGAFRGGAILPGLRLMAQALHQYTALLPLIDLGEQPEFAETPGTSTAAAMRAGVFWAVAGGARALIERYSENRTEPPRILVTGGDGYSLWRTLGGLYESSLTLHGIRLAAEALP